MLAARFRGRRSSLVGMEAPKQNKWPVGAKLRPRVTESEIDFLEGC